VRGERDEKVVDRSKYGRRQERKVGEEKSERQGGREEE